MGALSEAIASSATAHGASIFTEKVNSPRPRFLQGSENRTISDSEGPSLSRWARQGSESGFRALQPVSGPAALNQVPVLLPAPLEVQPLSQPLHWRRGWLRPHLGAAENRQRVRKLVVPVSSTMAKSPKTQPACPFPGFPGLQTVASVQVSSGGRVQGVVLQDGSEVRSRVVLSNASPQSTFLKLTPQVRPGGVGRRLRSQGLQLERTRGQGCIGWEIGVPSLSACAGARPSLLT